MYQANEQTIEMTSFGIEGNVIDHSWYHIIKDKKNRIAANAILLLTHIVYWYRPTIITDESTGQVKIYKKFKADILQRSYTDIEKMIGFTKDQARDALEILENLGIAQRVLRTIDIYGTKTSNILFIKFDNKKLEELQKNYYLEVAELKKSISMSEISDKHIGKNRTAPRKKPTYTKTTTETPPKISLKDNVAKQEIEIDNVFCKEKDEEIGKSKFPLKKDQLPIFEEMKALDLGCSDETLKIIIRQQTKLNKLDFLKQCIHHVRLKIESGFKFKKEKIAFFRNCLSGKQSLVTENCIENKKLAEEFCKDMQWHNVKITDKFIEATDGNISKEIPTMLPKNQFERMLGEVYRLFNPLEEMC